MATYRLSPEAEADLIRIHQWGIRNHGEVRADRYFWKLIDCFESIALNPLHYRAMDEIRTGYRRCVCGRDSIYYRIADDTIEIMAIIGQQELNSWL
jgi:toxin ParE1/3/4